jgi:hypothetical protein
MKILEIAEKWGIKERRVKHFVLREESMELLSLEVPGRFLRMMKSQRTKELNQESTSKITNSVVNKEYN